MSILHWHITPARAHLAADTLVYLADGSPASMGDKILPVPSLRMAIACIGSTEVLLDVYGRVLCGTFPRGLDSFVEWAPAAIAESYRDHAEGLRAAGLLSDFAPEVVNFAAVGWSESAGRMVGTAFDSADDFAPVPLLTGEPLTCIPQIEGVEQLPGAMPILKAHERHLRKLAVPETFIAVAKLQQLYVRDRIGFEVGGELVLFEITKQKIESRVVHRFANYTATLAAIEARDKGIGGEGSGDRPAVA